MEPCSGSLSTSHGAAVSDSKEKQRMAHSTMRIKPATFHPRLMMLAFTMATVFLLIAPITFADAARDESGEAIEEIFGDGVEHMNRLPSLNYEGQRLLSRRRRSAANDTSSGDKSIWDEIEEFYSDKNNMAMYCVLPIMVLIYGGCAAIYCIHKCRQYVKRRKHKRLKEEDCDSLNSDKNDLNQNEKSMHNDNDRPISQISNAWTDMNDSNGNVQWSGQTEANDSTSPLPWQVPEKAAAAALLSQNTSRGSYMSDRLRDDDMSMEEGRRSQASLKEGRPASRTSTLDDTLIEEELNSGSKRNNHHSENVKIVSAAAAANSDNFGESTDDRPNMPPASRQHQQQRQPPRRQTNEATRADANINELMSRSSTTKATDYSRFAEAKPIEIVPLTADPSLRVWDPLHRRPWGEKGQSRSSSRVQPMGEPGPRSGSVNQMKEEMLARYDALSTFQMAKKAAEILKTNAVEKSPFKRNHKKKKHIFIAE